MIDEDENDFRFVIVKAVDFEILCEIVSAVDHESIVPRKWQVVKSTVHDFREILRETSHAGWRSIGILDQSRDQSRSDARR